MVDFHTSRPGHDLRYSLSPDLLSNLGWEPKIKLSERIDQMVREFDNHQLFVRLFFVLSTGLAIIFSLLFW